MKRIVYLGVFCSILSFGSSLEETIILSEQNPSIKAAMQKAKVYKKLHDATQSGNYPSLDFSYGATYLNENPVMYFGGATVQVQSKNLYTGAIKLTYPLFTGFAISSQIDKSKFRMNRASLEADDAKRNLYMGVVQAYTAAFSLKHLIISEQKVCYASNTRLVVISITTSLLYRGYTKYFF